MAILTSNLEAKAREGSGKGFARRTRLEGKIPAIVYGKHLKAPVSISLDPLAVKAAINTPRKLNTLISLKIGGNTHMVMLKDYQQDPVTRALLHADFIDVRETDQVRVNVPSVAERYHSITVRFVVCAGIVASTSPSPSVSLIASVLNEPAPSSRQCRVAVALVPSSWRLHETTIGSVVRGISGLCFTSLMSGATFAVATEFTAPGEPPGAALKPQFCPES